MSHSDPSGYGFADWLPVGPVAPGSTVLVSGEQFSRAEDVARSMVLDGGRHDEGALFITTTLPCGKFLDACRRTHPSVDPTRLGVVDCTGQDIGEVDPDLPVRSVATQGDLTGMGIEFSSLYESLYGTVRDGRVRVGLLGLSSLVMYVDVRTLFRFAQTLSGRIQSAGGLGVFTIDPSAHDSRTVSVLGQVADGKVDVETTDADGTHPDADGKLRVRGLRDQPDGWQPFTFPTSAGD